MAQSFEVERCNAERRRHHRRQNQRGELERPIGVRPPGQPKQHPCPDRAQRDRHDAQATSKGRHLDDHAAGGKDGLHCGGS